MQQLADYPSVQKYIQELQARGVSGSELQQRLTVLAEFCHFVGQTPDEMLAAIFDVQTSKYKKRNFYTARVKEFSAQIAGTWSQQTARGNVIRSFFIANGRRLPHEKPSWL
jgi:hypothetical protein